jgi:two-component system sensor histidine kinase CpxA
MRSLLIRIFLSFWLIIAITIGTAALAGYWYAERLRDEFESFDLGDTMLEASAALETGGRDALVSWLRDYTHSSTPTVFVLDDSWHDLLGRDLPRFVYRDLERHRRFEGRPWRDHRHNDDDEPANLRRARPHAQLLGPDGTTYTFVVSRVPPRSSAWSPERARLLLLGLAVIISTIVSFLLARALTRPVTKLRDATVALANGNLDVRVAESVGGRSDELGLLARDFDTKADKLQRSARQQSELSRNISHELRSPLARMRVALELARRQSGELSEFDRIDEEAERLDKLIGQILSYTRLDSSTRAEAETVDLGDLVQEVVENVNFECRSEGINGITVRASIESTPTIDGHRFALSSAVENVLRNAVRHSPAGAEVNVTLRQSADAAVIEILDQGPGVEQEELARLFDAFFRTRRAAEDGRDRGTGLGLAIAQRAVRMHNGDIEATNAAEGGLLVTLTVPLNSCAEKV